MTKRIFFVLLLATLLFGAAASPIAAQSVRGRIEGVVRDQQNLPVANASITTTNIGTNETQQATSSEEGTFAVPELQPGAYRVTAEVAGFKRFTTEGVIVQVATVANVTIALEVGGVTEQVTVAASDAQEVVNTSTPEVGGVIDRQRILDLPLDGRNPLELTALQPGVSTRTGSDGENQRFSINGNRTVANNVTVDGVNASDNYLKTAGNIVLPVIPVSVESVGEFRVTTALPTAEFGRGTTQTTVITASGTNNYRGSLFLFHRNTIFNANTFFNNSTILPETGKSLEREPLIRNQFGGRFSGPIFKNKTHFFSSYEGKRESRGISRLRTVYTAEARQGIFRYLKGVATTPARVAAAPVTVPASQCGSSTVPNGAICVVNLLSLNPATRGSLDPAVSEILALTPLPNNFQTGDGLNTGGFRFNSKVQPNSDQFAFRLDHKITDKHKFETTYNYGDIAFLGDYLNDREPLFPDAPAGNRFTIGRGITGTLRSAFSPTLVNEFRTGAQISNLRFTNDADFARGFLFDFSQVTDPIFDYLGTGRNLRVVQFTDNLTWVRGSHIFKFGADIRSLWVNRYSLSGLLPLVDFSTAASDPGLVRTTQFPGIPATTSDYERARGLLNTITGAMGNVTQSFNAASRESGYVPGEAERRTYANEEFDFYGQDTWKVRSNLTLSLGLRYEYSTVPRETNGLALLPVGGSAGLYGISGKDNLFNPGVLEGSPTVLNFAEGKLFNDDRNNFAPVLGFAYDPFKNGKTSIRGGFRVSYVRGAFSLIDELLDENEGLGIQVQRVAGGYLRNGVAQLAAPGFAIPYQPTIQTNSLVDVRAFDENLTSPYVTEWTASIQREIFKNTSLEVRYVGNRGHKLYRAADINEVNIFARDPRSGQTFLEAFKIAQNNLAAFRAARPTATTQSFRYDATVPGSLPNPLFETLFTGFTTEFTNSNYFLRLEQGRAGDFADYVSRVRLINNQRGAPFFAAVARGELPINFFRANPLIRGAQLLQNASSSQYDALQIELNRRLTQGLRFQFGYTFAKGISDFIGNTSDTNSFVTLRNTNYERQVTTNAHQFVGNFIYQLPFGRGRKFLRKTGNWNYLVGGWQIGGLFRWESGDPLSITSGRGTFNRDDRSALNTVDVRGNLTRADLQKLTGVRSLSNGVFYLDPNLAPGSTSDAGEVVFDNPQAGTLGSLGLGSITGPSFFNFDFSVIKRTRFRENLNAEFRAEIFNVFNTVNFGNPITDINSVNFGKITYLVGRPRVMQFALRLNF